MSNDVLIPELRNLESIEIRPAKNGFLVTTRTKFEDSEDEFVFDSHQKTLRFVKTVIFPSK